MIVLEEGKQQQTKTAGRRTPALELTGVGKRFGAKVVLENVNLAIASGELLAIVGRSGCGKSTLLRLLVGLEESSEGSILVKGAPMRRPNRAARLMFQDAALLPWQTVLENVALAAARGPGQRQEAGRALELVGLEQRAKDWPSILSGGQRQRVALARAL